MTLPSADTYQDVNADSSFIGIEMNEIQQYLCKFEKKFEQHITQLYKEKFLRYFRISKDGDKTYIRSSCHAEMRKSVCYTVDIEISRRGSVVESQCECAAGMGPHAHCKHVCVVLYGGVMFLRTKMIKTEETCTQRLQTFHKCKKFVGSPIKAKSLDVLGADEFTNLDFDPRPEQYRDDAAYPELFRNVCLNFPGISEMPIFQTFRPANTYGVAHDHDYLKLSPEEMFLEKMQISNISDAQINAIERATVGQSLNAEWAEERTKRFTSSNFGRICKCTDKTDKHKLARSLTMIKHIKAAPIEHGRVHEPVALEKYQSETGNIVNPSGLVVSQMHLFLAASPDGIVTKDHLVEVKCPYVSRDKEITTATVPYLMQNDDGTDFLNENHDYFYQIQGQLLCTGAKSCTLIVCAANNLTVNDIKYIEVARNDSFIVKMILKLQYYYEQYFKAALLERFYYKPIH